MLFCDRNNKTRHTNNFHFVIIFSLKLTSYLVLFHGKRLLKNPDYELFTLAVKSGIGENIFVDLF